MNIVYTCDDNYVWLMGISVISLLENNTAIEDIKIYLLGENISKENKNILRNIGCKYNREIIIIDIPQIDIPKSLLSCRWPLSAFTRLYAGQLLPQDIGKVLYLDCDTIISGNISCLDDIDISGSLIYGVRDCISKYYKKNIGIEENDIYINAGVLLINLEELRKINIKDKIERYLNKYKTVISYADQDVLNGIFNKKIDYIDCKYNIMTIDVCHTYDEIITLRRPTNFYTEQELINGIKNPIIIHYTTNMRVIRPWYKNSNHPLKHEFNVYKDKSPWRDLELKEYKFMSKEMKVVEIIEKLPKTISYIVLGIIHSILKPIVINIKSRLQK